MKQSLMKRFFDGCKFFAASCVPGCGQMYQGYMKRGLSLMLVFSALLAVAVFLEMGALAVMLVPVWLYSFFDGYNLRRRLEGAMVEDGAEPDAYLFDIPEMDGRRLSEIMGRRHSVIGWTLVILGGYMLYQELVSRIFRNFWSELYYFMRWDVPRMLLTVLIILLGVWFIRGPKKRPERQDPPYAFTPPVPPAEEPRKTAEAGTGEPEAAAESAPREPVWPQVPVIPAEPKETEQEADHDNG